VELLTSQGVAVWSSGDIDSVGPITIDLGRSVSPGAYLLSVRTDKGTLNKKVVLIK